MGGHLRTGEVHLNHVRTSLRYQAGQLLPVLLRGPHDGGNQNFIRIVLLQPPQVLQVLGQGVLRDLLHVLEANERSALLGQGVKARGDLINQKVIRANRLEYHAAPAGIIGFFAHVIAVAHRRRGQTEWIFKMYAKKFDG